MIELMKLNSFVMFSLLVLFVCFWLLPPRFECRRKTLADANMKDLTTVDVASIGKEV